MLDTAEHCEPLLCIPLAGVGRMHVEGPAVATAQGPARALGDGAVQSPVPRKREVVAVKSVRQRTGVANPVEIDHSRPCLRAPRTGRSARGVRPVMVHRDVECDRERPGLIHYRR